MSDVQVARKQRPGGHGRTTKKKVVQRISKQPVASIHPIKTRTVISPLVASRHQKPEQTTMPSEDNQKITHSGSKCDKGKDMESHNDVQGIKRKREQEKSEAVEIEAINVEPFVDKEAWYAWLDTLPEYKEEGRHERLLALARAKGLQV